MSDDENGLVLDSTVLAVDLPTLRALAEKATTPPSEGSCSCLFYEPGLVSLRCEQCRRTRDEREAQKEAASQLGGKGIEILAVLGVIENVARETERTGTLLHERRVTNAALQARVVALEAAIRDALPDVGNSEASLRAYRLLTSALRGA